MSGIVREAFGSDPQPNAIEAQIGQAAKALESMANELASAKETDTARYQSLKEEVGRQAASLSDLQEAKAKADAEREHAELMDQVKAVLSQTRTPARTLGATRSPAAEDYRAGEFIYNILRFRDQRDFPMPEDRAIAKARLDEIAAWESPDEAGSAGTAKGYVGNDGSFKATLGLTDATGGWIIPNAQVAELIKPGRYSGAIGRVVRRVPNVQTSSVDIPYRTGAPSRAVIAAWGDQKELRSLTYGGYTATLYTVAAIYDLSKQFVKYSAGAAEADVLDELGHAFGLGEAYYILQGSGTSEPYGLQTALAGIPAMTTSHSPATTLAGAVSSAIAKAAGALAARNRQPEAALLHSTGYWTMLAEGTDTAGFFFSGINGPEGINPGTLISPFGIPVYPENQLAGTDDLIVGEFSALKVYYGDSFRVDTSDVAYDRWDKNLVGFRGEMEIGLDARPAVYAGAFAFVADVIP